MKTLFQQDLKVVNVGLQGFADNIVAAGGHVTHLSWAPPAGRRRGAGLDAGRHDRRPAHRGGQPHRLRALSRRPAAPGGPRRWRSDAIAGLAPGERRILHSGPPIAWAEMCGPQQGAITGAILYEGWASSLEAAERLAAPAAVALEPCHEHGAVGPMAGIISPSMPVWVVENTDRRQPGLLQSQRGSGQGAALRRQLARSARPAALAGHRVLHRPCRSRCAVWPTRT